MQVCPVNDESEGVLEIASTLGYATAFQYYLLGVVSHVLLSLPTVRQRALSKAVTDEEKQLASAHVHIVSVNNFPTAAGLASSASGYACLGTYIRGVCSALALILCRSRGCIWTCTNTLSRNVRRDCRDSVNVIYRLH